MVDQRIEISRPGLHSSLEALPFFAELLVPELYFVEHLIELIAQNAGFVIGCLGRPDRIVFMC